MQLLLEQMHLQVYWMCLMGLLEKQVHYKVWLQLLEEYLQQKMVGVKHFNYVFIIVYNAYFYKVI